MKHFSVLGYQDRILKALKDANLMAVVSQGRYKGSDEACIVVEYAGKLEMERVRKDINKLAYVCGEESVLHYNFGVASLEFGDGTWKIATDQQTYRAEPTNADFVKLTEDRYVAFTFGGMQ